MARTRAVSHRQLAEQVSAWRHRPSSDAPHTRQWFIVPASRVWSWTDILGSRHVGTRSGTASRGVDRDLGKGVVFAVVTQNGRPVGSAGHVRQREGWVYVWVGGLIARLTISYIDEARAVAERLAEERG